MDIVPLNYYLRAFAAVEKKIAAPHYFFFSDDINWVKENLSRRDPQFILIIILILRLRIYD